MRALQPHEMFVSQRYVTAVYRSELALRLEHARERVEFLVGVVRERLRAAHRDLLDDKETGNQ